MRAFDLLVARGVRDPLLVAAAASLRDGAASSGFTCASSRRSTELIAGCEAAGRDAQRALRAAAACRAGRAEPAPRPPAPAPPPPRRARRRDRRRRHPRSGARARGNVRARRPPPRQRSGGVDLKSALLVAIREQNKMFFGMVVAQAQTIDVEGDTRRLHVRAGAQGACARSSRASAAWIEQLAQAVAGRKIAVVAREGQPAPAAGGRRRPRSHAQGRSPRPREGRADRAGRARRLRRRDRRRRRD